jgi:peptidoglycan/xylan/chitin deacetylase (PgdA/CDA1 family)
MKVVISIDVEPSIAGFFDNPLYTPLFDEPISCDVNGKSEGLGFLINLFKEYNFIATFFIETVHNAYFPTSKMEKYIHQLLEANQDIQLHLHPIWSYFKDKKLMNDNCADYPIEFIAALIQEGKEYIKQWTGKNPIALRTGGFSVGNNVYHAMRMENLHISSNICAGYSKIIDENLLNITHGVHRFFNITEIPVTCFYERNLHTWKTLRQLQVTAVGAFEMIDILNKMQKNNHKIAMIVTHPFEFVKKDNYRYFNIRINKMIQARMESLCYFLKKNSDRFQVIPISEAAQIEPYNSSYLLKSNPVFSFLRATTNFINDRI